MAEPRVSVICIFLNEERFLAEAVESVLAQTYGDYELHLIDDGSTDGSTQIAHDYERRFPGRIRYFDHAGHANRGMSAARNLGLAHARGEFITFIDADDVWRPRKLIEQLAILDAHPEVGMVCGTVNYWASWEGGEDQLIPTGGRLDAISAPPDTTLSLYPFGTAAAPGITDVMVRRAIIEAVKGFEEPFTGMYEDQAFFAKIYLETKVYFSRLVWFDYRLHADSCLSRAHRDGGYAEARRHFLDWFAGYLELREPAGQAAIRRALAGARWRLAHPIIAGAERRLRSLVGLEPRAT